MYFLRFLLSLSLISLEFLFCTWYHLLWMFWQPKSLISSKPTSLSNRFLEWDRTFRFAWFLFFFLVFARVRNVHVYHSVLVTGRAHALVCHLMSFAETRHGNLFGVTWKIQNTFFPLLFCTVGCARIGNILLSIFFLCGYIDAEDSRENI